MAGQRSIHEEDARLSFDRFFPLLRAVSRSFYLTVRVLPRPIRAPIGLAYLLARATDTVADTEMVAVEGRFAVLATLRDRILGQRQDPVQLGEFGRHQVTSAERELLERFEELLGEVDRLSESDRRHVREVLSIIVSGQELDVRRFAGAAPDRIVALQTDAELDDYIYRVAGCVGEFWTRICRAHLFSDARLDEQLLLTNGVRFGKGLQLVNVLRDLPRDLRQGRCYLPADRLGEIGLKPQALLASACEPRLRPLFDRYLDLALDYLRSGWAYTNALPRRPARVRLACAWPVLIGVKTLVRLRSARVLDPVVRVKVSRAEVRRIVVNSVLRYPFPSAWASMFERAGR